MSTAHPSPLPLPSSLTTSTTPLPTATQRALITHLRATPSTIPDLSILLSDSLARTGWTDRVRALALELLRNGSCDTFPELMEEVMRRAKIPRDGKDAAAAASSNGEKTNGVSAGGAGVAGGAAAAGGGAIVVSKEWSGGPDGLPDVRVPIVTVEGAVEFLRERIKDVVEVVEEGES